MGHLTDPFYPNIHFDAAGVYFADVECSELRVVNGPRVVTAEICVRSRRDGGSWVTARSKSRSYRRAQAGKTTWGFGVITVGTGRPMITYAGDPGQPSPTWTLAGTVNP